MWNVALSRKHALLPEGNANIPTSGGSQLGASATADLMHLALKGCAELAPWPTAPKVLTLSSLGTNRHLIRVCKSPVREGGNCCALGMVRTTYDVKAISR